MRGFGILVFGAIAFAACGGPTEKDIQREFDAFVGTRNQCQSDADCVLASSECPLGCFAPVRAEFRMAVEAKARELVDEYKRGCSCDCDYDCVSAVAACREGRCEAVPQ